MFRRLLGILLALAGAARAGDRGIPVLVELFTSEGCSSCPPADALLARLVREQPIPGVEVVALSEHVDYWDSLGWKDRFSSPAFTDRQSGYASRLGRHNVYTPQAVVDGRTDVVGTDERGLRSASQAAAAEPHGTLSARREGSALRIEATLPTHHGAEVLLAAVEESASSRVERGENAGRTLSHTSVVRSLTRVGETAAAAWTGRVELQPEQARLRLVLFVQERGSRRVLASASLPPSG